MQNAEIIDAFVAGATAGQSNSMSIHAVGDSTALYSYGEVIAQRAATGSFVFFYLDTDTKYSQTTSAHQRATRDAVTAAVKAADAGKIRVRYVSRDNLRIALGLPLVPPSVARKGPRLYSTRTGERLTRRPGDGG